MKGDARRIVASDRFWIGRKPQDMTLWARVRFWFAKEHKTLDFGYSRVDPTCLVCFKCIGGRVYITKMIK